MKLVLGLVLLLNVQIIYGFNGLSPFGGFFQVAIPQMQQLYGSIEQPEQWQNNGFQFNSEPIIYEKQGLDANGNPFFEKDIIRSSFSELPMIEQESPIESRFEDYFEPLIPQQQLQREEQEMGQYLNAVTSLFNKDAFKSENLIFGNPRPQPQFQEEILINHNQEMRPKKKYEFLQPASAIEFKHPIGLGPFHFQRDADNGAQTPDENLLRVKQTLQKIREERDRAHEIEEQEAKPLMMNMIDMSMENKESEAIKHENDERKIKLDEMVVSKEKTYLQELTKSQPMISNEIYLDEAYMYIQLNKRVTSGEANELLKYISELAGFPFEWIKDISISGNLVVFRANDEIDLNVLCKIIEDNHSEVLKHTSLHVVSCSPGNVDIQRLKGRKSESKKILFITIVVVSAVAVSVLICLLCLFAIKRKAYLQQKLIENVSSMKQKPNDDIEQLIHTESGKNFISQIWPFKTKSFNVQQAVRNPIDFTDLSRSTTKLNATSPLNNTQITDLSNRCDTLENTPVIVDERAESTRSSASS